MVTLETFVPNKCYRLLLTSGRKSVGVYVGTEIVPVVPQRPPGSTSRSAVRPILVEAVVLGRGTTRATIPLVDIARADAVAEEDIGGCDGCQTG